MSEIYQYILICVRCGGHLTATHKYTPDGNLLNFHHVDILTEAHDPRPTPLTVPSNISTLETAGEELKRRIDEAVNRFKQATEEAQRNWGLGK
jgi:hypothetical protein